MDSISPVEHAHSRTQSIQDDLSVASAELHLTTSTLERSLPEQTKKGDVRKALDHNEKIEEKVMQAAEELDHVSELLAQEVAQRRELEKKLKQRDR